MSLNTDDEILQDFLVEAGELLEGLNEQLVDLERNPTDRDLLNAVFRGFHTIKGGAGFLNLNNLVAVCHRAEDVFNLLRQGQRSIDAELMDAVLQVLDVVNGMFAELRSGEEPGPADADLLERLKVLADPNIKPTPNTQKESNNPKNQGVVVQSVKGDTSAATLTEPMTSQNKPLEPKYQASDHIIAGHSQKAAVSLSEGAQDLESLNDLERLQNLERLQDLERLHDLERLDDLEPLGDITDTEFEALLDAMDVDVGGIDPGLFGERATPAFTEGSTAGQNIKSKEESGQGSGEEISEDEFERLLDQLHGRKGPAGDASNRSAAAAPVVAEVAAEEASSDTISDDEFERLLDQLHGKPKLTGTPPTAIDSPNAQVTEVKDLNTPGALQRQGEVTGSGETQGLAAEVRSDAGVKPEKKPASAPAGGGTAETTVRVDTKRLDDIMNLVGELVLVRNRLATLRSGMRDEQVAKAVSNLDVVTADLQAAVMKTRMQPIKKVFGRFPRVVRDLARSLKKEIELELQGEDTDLDKNLVEALADPLVHLVRNAVDHGIELPEERVRAGKPRIGRVVLAAAQEGDHILLTISDDGKGMDPDVLRGKAVEKGLMEPEAAARLSDSDAFNLIFMAGFSTKTEISDVSGRGVGMDVVKTRIAQLNGRVDIESVKGQGSILRVKVPLTLAILPTLMVVLGNQRFALPLASVSEIFNLDLSRTNHVDDQEVVMVRNHALPLFYLRQWLVRDGYSASTGRTQHVVVVFVGNRRIGLVVDRLIGQEEVVIKPLGAALHGLAGFAGATITGDGGIALILDVPSLLRAHGGRFIFGGGS